MQGWYPLGGRGHTGKLLGDSVISEIAGAHGVSSAQVILRWNLQKGVVVIPGSSNPDHIMENPAAGLLPEGEVPQPLSDFKQLMGCFTNQFIGHQKQQHD